ncbi:MAG: hypothetical protein QGI83_03090 [Candidatus Latescibacteria bacterium]|jgi:hypothetical protein|nr:hypothetical protein [Candidatus Latescibacterota bacterium]
MPICSSFRVLDLGPYYNNDGISTDENRADGDFTGAGVTYPAEDLPPSYARVEYGGVAFRFPSKLDGLDNNVSLEAQAVPVYPGLYSALHVLGSGEDSLEDIVHFVGEDGNTHEPTLALSAWHRGNSLLYGELQAIVCTGYHHSSGHIATSHLGVCYGIWMQSVRIRTSTRLVSIRLPDNPGMHIFAMTLARGPAGTREVNR